MNGRDMSARLRPKFTKAHRARQATMAGLLLFSASLACARTGPRNAPFPDLLIVLPGATHVAYTNEYEGALTYELPVRYPALTEIQTIRTRLEGAGWTPLEEDFLNPGIRTSL